MKKLLSALLALALILLPAADATAGVGSLGSDLQGSRIEARSPGTLLAGDGRNSGLFDELAEIFKTFFAGLKTFLEEIFGGSSGGSSGGSNGGNTSGGTSGGNNGGNTSGGTSGGTTSGGNDGGATSGGNFPKDDSWRRSFNRENTMSNEEFTNVDAMTEAQVQAFFQSKGSILAKPTGGVLPSHAIIAAAKKHKINPKLLIARLQMEQGLVSAKSATQYKLDWALGCGALDGGRYLNQYKGFANQMDGGAKTLRRWFDDGLKKGAPIPMTIDGQRISLKNAATYSLYKYTPHFQGNKLHWQVYTGYFKD